MTGTIAFGTSVRLRNTVGRTAALAVLVAIVGALILATVAGARRTSTALERFKAASRAADVELDGAPTAADLRTLRNVDGVRVVGRLAAFGLAVPRAPDFQTIGAPEGTAFGNRVDRDRIVAGRASRADAPREVTIGESLAARLGVRVDGVLRVNSFSPDQVARVLRGESDAGPPGGPIVRLHVVGIVRRPLDLGEHAASDGLMVLTPAFASTYRDRIGVFGSRLRIRTTHGAADVPRVLDAARRIMGDRLLNAQGLAVQGQGAQRAIDALAVALWIAAAVTAISGLTTIAILFSREIAEGRRDVLRLRELGCTRLERVLVVSAPAVVAATLGMPGAVAGAIAISPRFPFDVARRADPDVGFHVDAVALVLGAAVLFVVLVAMVLVTAARLNRRPVSPAQARRPIVPSGLLATGSPSLIQGVRLAIDRGRGPEAVPLRSAQIGAMLAVAAIVAALVYTSSLDRVVSSPVRYGAPWQFAVMDTTSNTPCGTTEFGIARVRGVASATELCVQNVEIAGRPITAFATTRVRGPVTHPTVVEGRAARRPNEVTLGATTLRAAGAHIGDRVTIGSARSGQRRYRIVGRALFPTLTASQPLGDGAGFTYRGYRPLYDQNLFTRWFVGRYAVRTDRHVVRRDLDAIPELGVVRGPTLPSEIDRLVQIGWLPTALATLVGLLGLAAIGHALVTAVRRRRRDFAILKALGFSRREVQSTVAWQSTILGLLGLLAGIPLGLLLGTAIWRRMADTLGAVPVVAVPVVALAVLAAATLLAVSLLAWIPGRNAAGIRPAVALGEE